jgi:predicted dithiol-disulfide oxidoreductase (DUF899 family)
MANGAEKHPVVSHDEWLAARNAFLTKEKEFTKLRDELSRQRRELPWEKIEKRYVFEGPEGTVTLPSSWGEESTHRVSLRSAGGDEGCPHCSSWVTTNEIIVHLNQRDVSFVAVSRASLPKIEAFRKRMGWTFAWLSSDDGDFNYDLGASFRPEEVESGALVYNFGTTKPGHTDREGVSVFYKDQNGDIFHTYSAHMRGIDMFNTAYHYLDIVPKGRDEERLSFTQAWVRHHDRYGK